MMNLYHQPQPRQPRQPLTPRQSALWWQGCGCGLLLGLPAWALLLAAAAALLRLL